MSFTEEEISNDFGVTNVDIEQTLLLSFNPYSGIDIDTGSFQYTNQGLLDSNQDGRIELGMFSFNDDNIASDNFPNVLGPPFIGITKTNMVNNGDCKFVEDSLEVEGEDETPIIVQPEGEWRFLSLWDSPPVWNYWYTNGDEQGFTAYGGRYAYVPLSKNQLTPGTRYWGNIEPKSTSTTLSTMYNASPTNQQAINDALNGLGGSSLSSLRSGYRVQESLGNYEVPHIAAWVVTDEAYSNKRCLQFMNFQIWNTSKLHTYVIGNKDNFIFNYLAITGSHNQGTSINGTFNDNQLITENQYRVLNQIQKIYDKFSNEPLNPYSSVKIKFKMKTTHCLPPGNSISNEADKLLFEETPLDESLGYAPTVEIGILQSQFEETPKTGYRGLPDLGWEEKFKAPGSFNSKRYFNGETFDDKFYTEIGGMNRFQNSTMNEWETFEFTYNLSNEHSNRGEIYGVKYGGSFNDGEDFNGTAVEIMLNRNFKDETLSENNGEIFFKIGTNYQEASSDRKNYLYFIPPEGVERGTENDSSKDDISVYLTHGKRTNTDYMVVATGLGDSNNVKQTTGLQEDGTFLEAYLMFIGSLNFVMDGNIGYGDGTEEENTTDMVVAYWDGERWSYDSGGGSGGYNPDRKFDPTNECFIIARLYASSQETGIGITGMDQYIDNGVEFPTDGVGNLSLFLQSGNNFQGRVLIDDIECFESYDFTPDVDVRKKKSVGNYGSADLTKYYDKEIEPEKYKDTQAPLEAQFYFYPQYPTDETFVERMPIYNDFKNGMFYIYDVNWGDGSINEFTSEPEQIDENTALYHTYETSGIFEVTGTMIRVKVDKENNIVGIAHNKKFRLRVNVNPGLDEDFKYFGSDGFSFIPFEDTVPTIGGISEQSNYYKTIKRQLGFLGDEKISIEYKNKSDKLKTELALLKMENQSDSDLEVLPNYMVSRVDENENIIYNGISPIKEELGKGIGDCDLTSIKYYNKPKSIWEMFGFEQEDLEQIGNPNTSRYWKNIIPEYYDIHFRNGLINELTVRIGGRKDIDTLLGDGVPPHYNIIINGVKYYDGFVEDSVTDGGPSSGQYDSVDFNIPIDRSLDIQEIRINYDNNSTPTVVEGDRNLYVNYIRINGVMFDTFTSNGQSTHNDINVYYDSPNVYNFMEDYPDQTSYNENGVSSNGAMAWNGDMVFEIPTKYFKTSIDFTSEQEWNDNYYYPVLPKFKADGTFSNTEITNQNIEFPSFGNITDEGEQDENLLINLINKKIEVDVINDDSGNKNYGFFIQDFKPEFDEKTLRIKKNKKRSKVNSSKVNGAF